jgi:hypothetical protein
MAAKKVYKIVRKSINKKRTRRINNTLVSSGRVIYNFVTTFMTNFPFILITLLGIYCHFHIEDITKILNKFAQSPIFKKIAEYLIGKVNKIPGIITVAGYLITTVPKKPLVIILPGYLIFILRFQRDFPFYDDVIIGILLTTFGKVRKPLAKLLVVVLAITTIVIGLWGEPIVDYLVEDINNNTETSNTPISTEERAKTFLTPG